MITYLEIEDDVTQSLVNKYQFYYSQIIFQ